MNRFVTVDALGGRRFEVVGVVDVEYRGRFLRLKSCLPNPWLRQRTILIWEGLCR